ncbi:major membrane immunogen (membrane-anchored lipoprotein) [Paenibacillus endophyticus]|uniref:Major membrane immunogen (Membrane-anchored lipoprotein) n=1 Tax=Paenibacillus endophyticus TaxID=1294268 RepID=A0A7W5GCY0_9BACL|nr:nuclear transport factor 2 family protein [Paenibacillus endophyticus]MBB3155874.1 major membrane immunogen (membrane-anchored lipoprotein) [Paenibacillus endophyticus]
MLRNKKLLILGVAILAVIITGCAKQNNQSQQNAQTEAVKITGLETATYQRLDDIEQIKQLKARYFRFVDEKKWTEFGDIFTSDAKIISEGVDYSKGGGAAYGKMIGDLVGKAPTVHHGYMPEIEIIDKDHATGIWAMEDLLTFPDAKDAYPGHHGYGQYHETYTKVNGVWKISSTELTRFRMDPLKNWDPNTDPVTGQPLTGK